MSRPRLEALPANALTVALYVAHLAPTWRPATPEDPPELVVAGEVCQREGLAPGSIARHLASIAVHHRAPGHQSPTRDPRSSTCSPGVRRHPGVAPPRRVAPALTAEVQAMVTGLDGEHDPAAAGDTAVILVSYTAVLRRSELAALTLADVTDTPTGPGSRSCSLPPRPTSTASGTPPASPPPAAPPARPPPGSGGGD